ncbi:MAG: hypothetical protein AB8I08_07160 [Sandaracinaceae bacterium]
MRRVEALGALLWLGCTMPPTAPSPTAAAELAQSEAPQLVVTERLGGDGPDAPDQLRMAFRRGDETGAPLDRLAIGWVPRWGDGAALVDPDGRLYEVSLNGTRRMLAQGAVGPLSADGVRLAYTTESGFLTDLHVHDGQAATTWARGLAAAGVLRLEGARLFFVGGPPGAVVGLWEARADGPPRCWSNCALRTGTDFGDAFVAPPGRAEDITPLEEGVRWVDAAGVTHEVTP